MGDGLLKYLVVVEFYSQELTKRYTRLCGNRVTFVTTTFSKREALRRYGIPDDDYGLAVYFYQRCISGKFDVCVLIARDKRTFKIAARIGDRYVNDKRLYILYLWPRFIMRAEELEELFKLIYEALCTTLTSSDSNCRT